MLCTTLQGNFRRTYGVPRNTANEASAFLKFIVDAYDALPEKMVFLHGHRYAYHMEDAHARARVLRSLVGTETAFLGALAAQRPRPRGLRLLQPQPRRLGHQGGPEPHAPLLGPPALGRGPPRRAPAPPPRPLLRPVPRRARPRPPPAQGLLRGRPPPRLLRRRTPPRGRQGGQPPDRPPLRVALALRLRRAPRRGRRHRHGPRRRNHRRRLPLRRQAPPEVCQTAGADDEG